MQGLILNDSFLIVVKALLVLVNFSFSLKMWCIFAVDLPAVLIRPCHNGVLFGVSSVQTIIQSKFWIPQLFSISILLLGVFRLLSSLGNVLFVGR